ncbi:hypothetical protein M427DRAFT_52756 [Gonapodya prolifera JEL478]|uniref:Uncharacterized protein n=1 Tax=Gonapodya prolifera (strain JEL478) TaxID=1344416 RepID=A0A139AT88_GONPJ|nr:hypothetical protein M427DRAFT_52756 [Gonapodya prolifera JEL478]|eukprot:KXS19938.1 hypothetical protein M427DRAFT_52756 [Gonapodya prolifera JEL478]
MSRLSSFLVFLAMCLLTSLIQPSEAADGCPIAGKWVKKVDAACSWYHNKWWQTNHYNIFTRDKDGQLTKFCNCEYDVNIMIGDALRSNGLQGSQQDGVYCFGDHVPFWQAKKYFDSISC